MHNSSEISQGSAPPLGANLYPKTKQQRRFSICVWWGEEQTGKEENMGGSEGCVLNAVLIRGQEADL